MLFIWIGAVVLLLAAGYLWVTHRGKSDSEWETIRSELKSQRLALEEAQRVNELLRREAARPTTPETPVSLPPLRPSQDWFTSTSTVTTSIYEVGPTVPNSTQAPASAPPQVSEPSTPVVAPSPPVRRSRFDRLFRRSQTNED